VSVLPRVVLIGAFNAASFARSQQTTESISALTIDELVQEAVSVIQDEVVADTGKPGKLARLELISNGLDAAIEYFEQVLSSGSFL